MALVLGSLSWIGPFAIDMYLPAMPAIAEDLNAPISAAQATLMAYFISFGISQLVYGPVSDVLGRKPPLYFGLTVFALASVGCALAPSIDWLIAMRFMQGVGAAGVMSIPRAVIRDCYTGNAATRLMSTVMLIISVSPMFAPLLGSAVIVPFGWRAVFVAVALISLLGFAMTRFGLRETLTAERRKPFHFMNMLRAFGVLLRDAHYMGLVLIGGMGMASFFAFLATSAFLYMDHYGLTSVQYSLAFAGNALGFFSASQVAANLEARFGALPVIKRAVAGYCTSACVLFVLIVFGFDSFPLLAILLFCT
ncbi:MAG TPA: multidrug effflux MFS transporter, partial [Hyphomicrobiales bacterium]|nr:multidrug effflux MFS transporter [Hyphomicrobiales bacterium]